ncbi:MAG: PilZ domain-containing protein [Deltaproteobacteria bacterium]
MFLKWSGPERRRFKRAVLVAEADIKIVQVSDGSVPVAGTRQVRVLNIGEGGVGFTSETELPLGADLEATLRFVLGGRRERAVTSRGRVCYCLLMGDYSTYQVGYEFTEISEADRKFLADYVRSGDAAAG